MVYLDADAFVLWEKGEFDLVAWMLRNRDEPIGIPATVWQQLKFGAHGWVPERAARRQKFLDRVAEIPVVPFTRAHADRAALLTAQLRHNLIGFADFQIAAAALEDDATLLTFNREHFHRVPGLKLAAV